MFQMLYVTLLFNIISYSEASMCERNTICSVTFVDTSYMAPEGCNETAVWSTTSRSKLSCAMMCLSNKTCTVFRYFRESHVCSMCDGELIQNLTFNSDTVYSWPFQIVETGVPSSNYTNIKRYIQVPNGINIGSVIHVTGYIFPRYDNKALVSLRLVPYLYAVEYPLCLHVHTDALKFHYNDGSKDTTVLCTQLPPGKIEINTTHTWDILVTKDGYNIYLDQDFCCFLQRVIPYEFLTHLMIEGSIHVYEIGF